MTANNLITAILQLGNIFLSDPSPIIGYACLGRDSGLVWSRFLSLSFVEMVMFG